jgi:hypothetical protein
LVLLSASAEIRPWAYERDSGLHFSYPPDLFERTDGDRKPSFHYFVSRDADAKFMAGLGTMTQAKRRCVQTVAAWNTGGYDDMTCVPRGRSWFVISGYRGDDIYYEK